MSDDNEIEPVIGIRPQDVHNLPPADFNDEDVLLRGLPRMKWVSVDLGGRKIFRFNWVTSMLASAILWGFVIYAAKEKDTAVADFGEWKSWVSQNFTWLYIGTQQIWFFFLIYLAFSKYGNIILGKDGEKPQYSNYAWFAMLFACGIGVGLYYWGVSEPMHYYRQGRLNKPFFQNDDQRAQMAIGITFFHWGVHAWVVYALVALILGLVSYRWDLPMTLRSAFYPLIGDAIYGFIGDIIDALSMACTTFGVCTSLGLGAASLNAGLHRQDSSIKAQSDDVQVILIWVITGIATVSVCTGLKGGIRFLSMTCFSIGCFMLLALCLMDNTWYLLNGYVENMFWYLQYVIQLGGQTDTYQQLNYEFSNAGSNLLWGSGKSKLYDVVAKALNHDEADGNLFASASDTYNSQPAAWQDWWTVFYWAWWISWAPFVGMFIAKISRGRTIRQVVIGVLIAPCVYSFFWLNAYGSLGIKHQRTVELALGVDVDWQGGTLDCNALGYSTDTKAPDVSLPNGAKAQALADVGYYAIACRAQDDRVFDIFEPYGSSGMTNFLQIMAIVGIFLYFITSSDSGSYVDDCLSAGGMEEPPIIQRIYWAVTEGATASTLVGAAGVNALSALQSISIIAGFPYTIAICFICVSLMRAVKWDMGDADIHTATRFNTGLFDWTSAFMVPRRNASAPDKAGRATTAAVSLFAPFVTMVEVCKKVNPSLAMVYVGSMAASFVVWIVLLICEITEPRIFAFGWAAYVTFVSLMATIRNQMRTQYNIYGNGVEDFFACLILYPFAAAQMAHQLSAPNSFAVKGAL
eukprot:CAMPEP_0182901104 /NCGR_PEP_ID=MMETSP0034_2-20130328/29354_1 /TAXON_ID=156128 /ORGANISM="Nephroselmis pyriformis, Strain CCMP717" /LENGTH=802 /DNA_ID=CAMNT_0025035437 /DNA_START=28 /DNA_END=2436 /DNA_ORIENTATION=+